MKRHFISMSALFAGGFIGWFLSRETPGPGSTQATSGGVAPSVVSRKNHPSGNGNPEHNLATLRRMLEKRTPLKGLQNQVERMSVNELRDWITRKDTRTDGDPALRAEGNALVMECVVGELFAREGIAALEWVDQLPQEKRESVLRAMTLKAAELDPIAAKPWVDRVLKDYGEDAGFKMKAEEGARMRSAEELAQVHELYEDKHLGAFSNSSFSKDFDFRKFLSLSERHFVPGAVTAWASRDPEAAAADILNRSKDDPKALRYTGALFHGVAAVLGDQEAARWIVNKLQDFPADQREEAVKSLRGNALLSKTEVTAILSALPTLEDRLNYASEVISPFDNPEASRQALATFPSTEDQTEVLLRMAPTYRWLASQKRSGLNNPVKFFQSTMEALNLPEASRQKVMDSLMTPPDRP